MKRIFVVIGSLLMFLSISGCCSFIPAPYSQAIYDQLSDAKKDSLALMDKGTTQFSENQTEIASLTQKMDTLKAAILKRCPDKDDPSSIEKCN